MNSQNLPWINIISFISLTKLLVASQFPQYLTYPAELSHQDCGGSFSCGPITGVDYPFRGYGDPEFCGYPGLVLDCQNNITTIVINKMTFRVLGVDQASQTMKIAREDVIESGCPHKMVNTSMDNSLFEYYSDYENLTFLYDCSSFAMPNVVPISCKAPVGYISVYLLSKTLYYGSCAENVTVPVSGWSGSTNSKAVQQAIQRGFEVRWKVDSEACSKCTASSGRCGFEIVTNRTTCYCPRETNTSDTCARAATPEPSPTPAYSGAYDELFQCGNLSNIGYPFWGGDRPSYCGDPSFGLTCKSNIPEIAVESITYRVLAIDETSRVLTVARNDYWNTVCPTQLRNASLDTTHFNYGSDSRELMLYYDCRILSNNIPILNQFSCTKNSTSNSTGVFVVSGVTSSFDSQLVSCNNSVIVQVNNTEAEALARASSVINVTRLLDIGFGLRWEANDTDCELCVKSGGRCGSYSSSFACYCPDQARYSTCGSARDAAPWLQIKVTGSSNGLSLRLKVGIGVLVSVFAIIILIITIYCLKRKGMLPINAMAFWKKERLEDQNVKALIRQYGSLTPKQYRYSDINKMTNAFKEKLGEGGYGTVYKGKLSNGGLVAVKILSDIKGNGEEFINEVVSISRTSHVNIVALLGFCFERNRRALIYEFVAKGSLDKLIYNDESLEWKTLYQIAVGIARGLEYLHRGCSTRIVHFDIKPHNILLDEEFCPKISDFGLAKLCQRKQSIISTLGARGTPGYIAPEVFSRAFGGVSYKSDVYSYGMLVLEITGARENPRVAQTSEIYFPQWIYEHLEHGKDLRLIRVTTREEEEIARKLILVGLRCIQTFPSDRPPMSKVLEMLEGSLESLQIPPKPSFFSPSRLQTSAHDSSSSTMDLGVEMSESNPSSFQVPSKQLQVSIARSDQLTSSQTSA